MTGAFTVATTSFLVENISTAKEISLSLTSQVADLSLAIFQLAKNLYLCNVSANLG
jgi:hypothetical protein